jgi:RNA polymerase sigma-70 factor (ECF subfamily)
MAARTEEVAPWLAEAPGGDMEALGQALEACRGYLLSIAQQELDPELWAKGGASDLVQETS